MAAASTVPPSDAHAPTSLVVHNDATVTPAAEHASISLVVQIPPSAAPSQLGGSASTALVVHKSDREVEVENAILELARALGLRRPEKGTLAAVRAVLTQMVWPSRLTDEAAWRSTGASRTNFMKYKRRILTVAVKEGWSLEGYTLPRGFHPSQLMNEESDTGARTPPASPPANVAPASAGGGGTIEL